MELSAIKRGRQAVRAARKNAPYHDRRRLNRKEFHIYINSVCAAMAGGEEVGMGDMTEYIRLKFVLAFNFQILTFFLLFFYFV